MPHMSGRVLITGGARCLASPRAEELPQVYLGDGLIERAGRRRGQVAVDHVDQGALQLERRGLTL
jgi:hypothetical protein